MKRITILASGSGTNASNIVKFFQNRDEASVDLILSNRQDAYVLERAKKLDVKSKVFSREDLYSTQMVLDILQRNSTDIIVLAGFLWLIPESIIRAFPNRILNIHPALLPAYGGKGMYGQRVHEAVITNGEKKSGITIHLVNEQYDSGDIIFQAECPVFENDSPDSLAEKIHELEYKHFPSVILEYLARL